MVREKQFCNCLKKKVAVKYESQILQDGPFKGKHHHSERCYHCGRAFITWMKF